MVLPLGIEGDRLALGTSQRPEDVFLVEEVRLRLGARRLLKVVVVPAQRHPRSARSSSSAESRKRTTMDVDEILSDIDEDDVQVD